MSLRSYRRRSEVRRARAPIHKSYEDLADTVWSSLNKTTPTYGVDVPISLFDAEVPWNLNKLNSLLNLIHSDYGINPSGLLNTYTYFGEYKTVFAWHTEDMDASSANYLHYGEPKTWYSVPAHDAHRFELLIESLIYNPNNCAAPLRHKPIIATPQYLTDHNIRWHTVCSYHPRSNLHHPHTNPQFLFP